MKLEISKSYLNRGGYVRRIASYDSISKEYKDFHGTVYNKIGKFISNKDTMLDLIEEFTIEPESIKTFKEITKQDIDNAAMDWYYEYNKDKTISAFGTGVQTSWNAAIHWYKSQLNQE